MKSQEFKKLIKRGAFKEAFVLLDQLSIDEVKITVYRLAEEDLNLTAYAFVCFLISQTHSLTYLDIAGTILLGNFPYLPGAEHAAYSYTLERSLLGLNRLEFLKEQLFFYKKPEPTVSAREARSIAKSILTLAPDDELGLEVLQETQTEEGIPIIAIGQGLSPRDKLRPLIEHGLFVQARHQIANFSLDANVSSTILEIWKEENICAYAFIWSLLCEKETPELHLLAAKMFENHVYLSFSKPLCGSDEIKEFHERQAQELGRN